MKRRDVLKMIPLSIAGITELAGPGKVSWAEPAGMGSKPLVAQVRSYKGTPTLFLNNEPSFAGMCWVDTPTIEGWKDAEYARGIAKAGIHIYSFDAGKDFEWVEPKAGRSDPFDFSTVEERYGKILDVDPLALFHLRLHFEFGPDDWWLKAFPNECEITSEGRPQSQSFASEVWRTQVNDFLNAFIAHLKQTGLIDRITAFQPGAGGTGEWVKGETSMSWLCADYSEPMRRHFRSWLRRQYHDDPARLKAAWNRPGVTFETAEVPPASEQLQAKLYTFRDPAQEQNVIDYFRCFADLSSDLVIDFCRTVKEATNGEKLAGAFYGYLLEMNNGGFHGERQESDYATYSRSGHLGLKKVFESPYVDFLVSPYAYGFRGIGGDAPTGQPPESAWLHGKLCIVEDDTRTYINHDEEYAHLYTLSDSVAILERNFARTVTQGMGMWWLFESVNPAKEPAFGPLLQNFHELGNFLIQTDRTPCAEIAVLVDEESFFYEANRINLDLPMILQQQFWGLPRLGAPFNVYLLQDFIEGRVQPYKLYIFLNALRLDRNRREAVNKELRRDSRVALWIYGSGYIEDGPSIDHMRELTGFTFAKHMQPWGPQMHILDYTHPITEGLPQDLVWGTNNKLCPIFCLDDPEARVLGQVVFSRGNCKPGMGVRVFPEWTSIYVAAPNLPAPLLRGIAGFAGVHVYNREGDVLYANRNLLGVHTVSGGSRTFRLPRNVEQVYDLFNRRTIARDATEFQVQLRPVSSSFFYTGPTAQLASLVGASSS
jgi:hypothetical protein